MHVLLWLVQTVPAKAGAALCFATNNEDWPAPRRAFARGASDECPHVPQRASNIFLEHEEQDDNPSDDAQAMDIKLSE